MTGGGVCGAVPPPPAAAAADAPAEVDEMDGESEGDCRYAEECEAVAGGGVVGAKEEEEDGEAAVEESEVCGCEDVRADGGSLAGDAGVVGEEAVEWGMAVVRS